MRRTWRIRRQISSKSDTCTEATDVDAAVKRENMLRAYSRVVSNKGAAGVDAMGVNELKPYLKIHWERIKEALLEGNYWPQPVRRVEIPKPGGRGMRNLGVPTVVDRLTQQAVIQAKEHVASGRRWVVD